MNDDLIVTVYVVIDETMRALGRVYSRSATTSCSSARIVPHYHELRSGWEHLATTRSKNHRDRASLAAPRLTLNRPCRRPLPVARSPPLLRRFLSGGTVIG